MAPPPKKSNKTLWIILGVIAFFMLLGMVVVCGGLAFIGSMAKNSSTTKSVKSANGALEIAVPSNWNKMALNDVADVQYGNPLSESYVIVISEPKSDIEGMPLDEYATAAIALLSEDAASPQDNGPTPVAIGTLSGLQYELHRKVDGIAVVYWVTVIEGQESFHQVISWTLASKETENEAVLKQVAQSFREHN